MTSENVKPGKRRPVYQDGKICFDRSTERKFFFVLTVIMLLAGALAKAGLF